MKTIKLPKDWSEISVAQLQQICDVLLLYPDNEVTQDISIINIFSGVSKSELLKMDFNKELKPLSNQVHWIKKAVLELSFDIIHSAQPQKLSFWQHIKKLFRISPNML